MSGIWTLVLVEVRGSRRRGWWKILDVSFGYTWCEIPKEH